MTEPRREFMRSATVGAAVLGAGVSLVPARVQDLRGLPPTFIGVGSIDLFVREDLEYAQRLIDAGVPVELQLVPGAYHAFEAIVPTATVSKQFTASINAALTNALAEKR